MDEFGEMSDRDLEVAAEKAIAEVIELCQYEIVSEHHNRDKQPTNDLIELIKWAQADGAAVKHGDGFHNRMVWQRYAALARTLLHLRNMV